MTPWVEYEKIRNKSFFTDRNPLCALFNHGRSFSTAMILIITLSWGIYYSYLYGISQFCNFSVLYGFVYVHICTRTANHETISLLSYRLLSWHAWWNISLVKVAVTSIWDLLPVTVAAAINFFIGNEVFHNLATYTHWMAIRIRIRLLLAQIRLKRTSIHTLYMSADINWSFCRDHIQLCTYILDDGLWHHPIYSLH